jgi:outer membrane protein
MRKTFSFIFWLFISLECIAQESLSLNDAIGIALKNNYSILIYSNEQTIGSNNNTAGNAGMLPSVSASGGLNETTSDLEQNYTDGRAVDRKGVVATTANAGVSLDWTLFDGFRMFIEKNRLSELATRDTLAYKIEIENTVEDVIGAYFRVVQQRKLIDAIDIIIAIDSERVVLAQTRLDVGSGARLDLLQSKVDLNEQLSTKLRLVATLAEYKDQLNYLLSRKAGTDFNITDSIVITYNPSSETLRNSVQQQNRSIMAAKSDQRVSLLSWKESKSLRYPLLDFYAGYNYNRNKSEAGFLLLNKTSGYNYGISLWWNLFDGFNVNRQVKNAKLEYQNTDFRLKDMQLQISIQLEKALRDFNNNLNILALEQENILLARENLDVAFERFRTGLSNSLELKNAQLSFQDAEVRLVQAQYAAKVSETSLMKLNGELVK